MDARLQARMVFHGAVVILLGLAAGFPFAFVVLGGMPGSERAWRMAHMEGLLNGLLVLAVAAVAPRLRLGTGQAAVLAWSLIVTAYANVVAAALGAALEVRGLEPGGSAANTLVYLLFMIAVVAVVVGLSLVAAASRRGGRTD